jgi:cytochrome c oxidase cbb3-type subunit I/II
VVLFVAGGAGYLAAAAKLVWPEFLSGVESLAYGRLLPASTNALVLGWLTLGLAGAAIWLVPRLGGKQPDARLTLPGLLLIVGGLGAGVAAVLLGHNAGGRYLELPWWADIAVGVGMLTIAIAATRAMRSAAEASPTAAWYVIAGLWVQFAGFAAGAIPGLDGVPAALQARFAATVVTGLGPVMIGIGVAYYIVGRLVTASEFHPRLGWIGFWSLLFSWLWMAPRELQYGPTPDWLETIPVVFGAGLVVAAVTVAADFAFALRGRWSSVSGSRPLQFSLVGIGLVILTAVQLFVVSLRGTSSILHFSLWEGSVEILALFGAATMFTFAAIVHTGRRWPRPVSAFHFWTIVVGLGVALASRWIGGLQQGYTWAGSVGPDAPGNSGEAFRSSVVALEGLQVTQVVGIGFMAVGALALLVGFAASFGGEVGDAGGVPGSREPLRTVLQGAALLFIIVAVSVVVLPVADTGDPPSLLAEASRPDETAPVAVQGRDLYLREGCWYCHTQQVRGIVTDVGLGPVSVVGDYANDDADFLGSMRIGPDLAHAGLRDLAGSARLLQDYLADPRAVRSWSTMPAFDYLSEDERAALAVYVAGLE